MRKGKKENQRKLTPLIYFTNLHFKVKQKGIAV